MCPLVCVQSRACNRVWVVSGVVANVWMFCGITLPSSNIACCGASDAFEESLTKTGAPGVLMVKER